MAGEQSIEQFKRQPRLPKFVVPRRYKISLKLDLTACKFVGSVRISIDVTAATRFLVLNSADLDIDKDSVSFTSQSSPKELRPSKIVLVAADETLVFKFDEVLPIGAGVLGLSLMEP